MAKFVDDVFDHLKSDIQKIRQRHRQYISYSNEAGAKSVVDEILNNALDECRTPRSPGNRIHIEFDERTGFILVQDNGRGIPTAILEELFTSLNMGSNINTANKANLKAETLGQNGTGTLAICGLAERVEITSYRGGTENIWKTIIFEEGVKVSESSGKCSSDQHGMCIRYKPSKVMGKNTKILWPQVHEELLNLQYLNQKRIKMDSIYFDAEGKQTTTKYQIAPFQDILDRNPKETFTTPKYFLTVEDDHAIEELDGETVKRFVAVDIAFAYTNSLNPYIDSFSNSNNTVDGGDHIDAVIESICRYFQTTTRNALSEREKSSLDIKWDDVRNGLSVVVALRTNFERLYTGQTKHKVVNSDIRRIIQTLTSDALTTYFEKNPAQQKELCLIVKTNARARREGDKIKSAVVKGGMDNWSAYKMKNFDPCSRRGLKEYKELFIIEGDSAKGSLKSARDPRYQALFAIRGVSANVFKMPIHQIIGPKGNAEFTKLTHVMGCGSGPMFNLKKLNYQKIIIASDADIDGLFIRSLLCAFFYKIFFEIVQDGRLFIAEPPLYRVDDKKHPFVINTADYIDRYVKAASKDYRMGYQTIQSADTRYLTKAEWAEFLGDTSAYASTLALDAKHYHISERLLEMILEEFVLNEFDLSKNTIQEELQKINIQRMIDRIATEFPEIYYDDQQKLIRGISEGRYQSIELSEPLVRRCTGLIQLIDKWGAKIGETLILKDNRTGTEHRLSMLEILKILRKYQPNILHRFKGLGENDSDDIRTTIMDPNTRTLIRVHVGDIENDMRIFQILRGGTAADMAARKKMMNEYKIPIELIDT